VTTHLSEESTGLLFDDRSLYSVKLESFEGPLDLLLHLIRKNELNIYDIPIADITRQYLEYIRLMEELNLEVAGEFLVMASTLLQIKSRMLLPSLVDEEGNEEEEDPRAELVRRLLEYQRYKDASLLLRERDLLGRETFARKFDPPDLMDLVPEEGPLEVELFQLIDAFRKVLSKMPAAAIHQVAAESTMSIADRITEILAFIIDRKLVLFDELFDERSNREFLVVTFLAILELCKLRMINIVQDERYGSILLTPAVIEESDATEGGHPDA
jgi:segregation and condensation protein A